MAASTTFAPKYWTKELSCSLQPSRHDGVVEPVALVAPFADGSGKGALAGQANAAVESHPALELRVGEVAAVATHLPDALVGLLPVGGDPLEHAANFHPEIVRERHAVLVVQVDSIHQFAVDVELKVAGGGVADADGAGAAVAVQMSEDLLGQVVPSVDTVHHVERAFVVLLLVGAGLHEVGEGAGFGGIAEAHEGVHGEGGIANPGVAVVPVAHAADFLGQAGGRSGDDGAGGQKREQFQDQGGAGHSFTPAPVVAAGGDPAAPEPDRLGEQAGTVHRFLSESRAGGAVREPQGEDHLFAALQGEFGAGAAIGDAHRLGPGEREMGDIGGKDCAATVAAQFHAVLAAGVIECGKALEPETNRAPNYLGVADQLAVGLLGLAARLAPDRHEIGDLRHALVGKETRDQDVGIGQIHLLDLRLGGGREAEIAADVLVEQRREDARGIEVGQAEPVDRTVSADKSDAAQVADDAVVRDREIAHCSE